MRKFKVVSRAGSVRENGGDWYCTRHLPSMKMVTLPETGSGMHFCAISGCPSMVVVEELGKICALPECDNLSTGRSKYCSRNCSNKNARRRYAERKIGNSITLKLPDNSIGMLRVGSS